MPPFRASCLQGPHLPAFPPLEPMCPVPQTHSCCLPGSTLTSFSAQELPHPVITSFLGPSLNDPGKRSPQSRSPALLVVTHRATAPGLCLPQALLYPHPARQQPAKGTPQPCTWSAPAARSRPLAWLQKARPLSMAALSPGWPGTPRITHLLDLP